MVTGKYTWNDKGLRAITSAVAKMTASRVRVGVIGAAGQAIHPETANRERPLKVWEVAAIQEFGTQTTPHIPSRSFIRSTLSDLEWLRAVVGRAASRVVSRKSDSRGALNWMGNVIVMAIQNTIMQGVGPANKPSTVDWKGHGHTLIGRTETMRNAISHEVVENWFPDSIDVIVPAGED